MATESSAGVSRLSAEQLKRIEENRQRAREKLSHRKKQVQSNTITQSSPKLSFQKQHPSSSLQVTTDSTARRSGENSRDYLIGRSHLECQPVSGANTTVQRTVSQQRHGVPGPSSVGTSNSVRYTELVRQPTIKANLILVSRQRFQIVVPYDKLAIEVFKKTPSNAYNAKTSVWSFAIEAHDKLVASLQRECRHIELSQIPKPVVSLFQSLSVDRSKQCHSGTKSECSWDRVETKLSSTLMQFQREGVEYCTRCGGRALLADDMGLGKTLQALAVMSHYRNNWPLLIICPSSVRMIWAEACQRWMSSLHEDDVTVILTGKLPTGPCPITIISYDLATKLSNELARRRPDAIIVDESHFLKNSKTNRCKAILPLLKSATRCLMLSGTPALSRPIELYTQITALDKSFRMSLVNFGIRYCNAVKNTFGWDFSGASNLNELHLYMQEKFMIRRLKNDVLDQLPSKRRQTVMLDASMTKTQCREVCELRKELEKAGMCKALKRHNALLPLFEKTGRLKLPAVRGYILDLLEGGRKLIVFGHHRSVLDSISESLLNKGFEHIRIDGRTPVETRQQLCDRFQHDESCLVAVLSITTANAGLTLTASSTVVFAELFWNPGILVQAEDRVYRIGQKNCVNIHYLVARETVDDFIWPLIQRKLTVLNKAGLTVDDFSSTESTVLKRSELQQDLLDLFSRELETPDNKAVLDVEGSSGDAAPSLEESRKRKRVINEPHSGDDPDFKPHSKKQKKASHKQVCVTTSPENITAQRTLTAMCSTARTSAESESEKNSEQTKIAADLASYLLTQQSAGHGSSAPTISDSRCEAASSGETVDGLEWLDDCSLSSFDNFDDEAT